MQWQTWFKTDWFSDVKKPEKQKRYISGLYVQALTSPFNAKEKE